MDNFASQDFEIKDHFLEAHVQQIEELRKQMHMPKPDVPLIRQTWLILFRRGYKEGL